MAAKIELYDDVVFTAGTAASIYRGVVTKLHDSGTLATVIDDDGNRYRVAVAELSRPSSARNLARDATKAGE